MAKESMKAREVKRVKLANRYAHKREEIAAKLKSGEIDHEEAWVALSKLPRNSNPIRQHFEGSDPRRYESKLVIFSDAGSGPVSENSFSAGRQSEGGGE